MKKEILSIFAILFFSISTFSQKLDIGITLKTNFPVIDIQDQAYEPFQSVSQEIVRTTRGKMGLEFGLKTKFKVFDQFIIISGIEARYIHFNKLQEARNPYGGTTPIFTTLGSYEIPPDPYGIINTDTIIRNVSGLVTHESAEFKGEFQKMLYLNFPFNVGYTSKSERWTFYGGFWYSYLLTSDFEFIDHELFEIENPFSSGVLGINLGVDFNLTSLLSIDFTYSGITTNIYKPYQKISSEDVSLPLMEKLPPSENFNLFSIGVTYYLK